MKKMLIIIGVLIVGFLGYWAWNVFGNNGEDEIHLIPENYVGVVTIVFNQKDGAEKKHEEGKRVYEIPENGILKTQFSFNKGYHKIEYLYVNKNNNRTKIDMKIPLDKNSNAVQIMSAESGTSESNDGKRTVDFVNYLVGKYSQADSLYRLKDNRSPADL